MAYSAVHHTNHVAQISVKPGFKSARSIRSAVRHNNRIGKEGTGAHIDSRRKFLNKDLLDGNSQDEIYLNLINRISKGEYTKENVPVYGKDEIRYADGRKVRVSKDRSNDKNDAVLAFELEATYPGDMVWSKFDENNKVVPLSEDAKIDIADIAAYGEIVKDPTGKPILDENGHEMVGKGYFKMPLSQSEFNEWCKATVEFAQERFGKENVASAQLHMDEQTPHIHIICTPVIKNSKGHERLNYYEMLGKSNMFGQLQDEYANAVSYIGYQRGERNSPRINSITTKEYKVRLSNEMSKDMPDTLNKAKDEIRNLRVRNFDLEERMSEIKVSASKFQKTRNKLDDKEKENEELLNAIKEQGRILERQRESLILEENRHRFIEAGIKNCPNKDITEAYIAVEKQLLEQGINYYKSIGYEEEQLRYWGDKYIEIANNETKEQSPKIAE